MTPQSPYAALKPAKLADP